MGAGFLCFENAEETFVKEILQDLMPAELAVLVEEMGEKKFRAEQLYRGIMQGKAISRIPGLPAAFRQKLLERFEDEPVRIARCSPRRTARKNTSSNLRTQPHRGGAHALQVRQHPVRVDAGGLPHELRLLRFGAERAHPRPHRGGDPRRGARRSTRARAERWKNAPSPTSFSWAAASRRTTTRTPCAFCAPSRRRAASASAAQHQPFHLRDRAEDVRSGREGLPVNLTVSLHAATDEERARIMPVAKAYKIAEILKACDYYFDYTYIY